MKGVTPQNAVTTVYKIDTWIKYILLNTVTLFWCGYRWIILYIEDLFRSRPNINLTNYWFMIKIHTIAITNESRLINLKNRSRHKVYLSLTRYIWYCYWPFNLFSPKSNAQVRPRCISNELIVQQTVELIPAHKYTVFCVTKLLKQYCIKFMCLANTIIPLISSKFSCHTFGMYILYRFSAMYSSVKLSIFNSTCKEKCKNEKCKQVGVITNRLR